MRRKGRVASIQKSTAWGEQNPTRRTPTPLESAPATAPRHSGHACKRDGAAQTTRVIQVSARYIAVLHASKLRACCNRRVDDQRADHGGAVRPGVWAAGLPQGTQARPGHSFLHQVGAGCLVRDAAGVGGRAVRQHVWWDSGVRDAARRVSLPARDIALVVM